LTLPEGFGVAVSESVRRYAGGRVLAGGSPYRVIRLSGAGARALEDLQSGAGGSSAARGLANRLIDGGLASPIPGDELASPPVTVIIPVRDRAAQLDPCLQSLSGAAAVVVDDGSVDANAIRECCDRHGAHLLRRPRPGGPSAARNAGLAAVETELAAFLDSDCVAAPGWLERLGRHFADPRVGAVAPRVIPRPACTSAGVRERYAASRSPLDLGYAPGDVGPLRPVAYVPAAALVVRRAALAAGFDERLRYGEDVDLVWRLRAAGWIVRYDPAVVVRHVEPASWKGLLGRRYRYGTSAAPLSRRHPGMVAPAVVPRRELAAVAVALAGRPDLGLLLAVRGPLSASRKLARAGLPPGAIPVLGLKSTGRTLLAVSRAATTLAAPALVAGLAVRRTRPAAAVLLGAAPLAQYVRARPALDPVRWTAAAIADDAAYGAGVWRGCLRERTVAPLRPRFARKTPSI
jgi:mycofactocin system glycosyltransferase